MTEKEIISSTYDDTADVYRIEEIEDENGITRQKRIKVYKEISCALSQKSTNELVISDTSNTTKKVQVLFTDDEIKILPADVVHITNIDKHYKAGISFAYKNSHAETILTMEEKS